MSKRLKERVQTGVDDQQKPVYKWAAGYSAAELQLDIARILVEAGMLEGVTPQPQETKNSRHCGSLLIWSTGQHSLRIWN